MMTDKDIDMSMFEDTFIGNGDDDLAEMLRNAEGDFISDRKHERFQRTMEDYKTPMFPGCTKEYNKLHVVQTLLQMKSSNGWSDKGFNELLQFLRDLFLEGNEFPKNMYHVKQIDWPLGLEVEKTHAYRNDCMLFRNGVNTNEHSMTTVNLKLVGYREELFVLAKDVTQVFYVKDMNPVNKEERRVVLQGKRKVVRVEDVIDEEDYNQFDDLPPFRENVELPLIDDIEEPTYIRRDHNEAIIVK
ncbi:uncharacterized protein LOC133910103 [Phragmites australis]|uniref:uncharacterized protein LOC133910103 n=1 Tax=Phragmites australis TaxID=29695 RepID=UPI002D77496E|nr:uncharacterized protein LOC133910103 [Phragmites australis]